MYPDHIGRGRDRCIETCQRTSTLLFKTSSTTGRTLVNFKSFRTLFGSFWKTMLWCPIFLITSSEILFLRICFLIGAASVIAPICPIMWTTFSPSRVFLVLSHPFVPSCGQHFRRQGSSRCDLHCRQLNAAMIQPQLHQIPMAVFVVQCHAQSNL